LIEVLKIRRENDEINAVIKKEFDVINQQSTEKRLFIVIFQQISGK
jgi:hypothetical protein